MRNVVIDLGNLEYLYSDTINAFIASNRHMLEVSGRIAILTEHPKVQDILKRAGLDNIMRIYRSEAEMIADSKEILRQTSSYRIEELQKISSQPADNPPVPKTEFEDFRAEMGQRLGSKLENNELPQFQMGLPQTAAPQNAASAPAGYSNPPASGEPERQFPAFNQPGFIAPKPPDAAPAPAFNNFNNAQQGYGAGTTNQTYAPQPGYAQNQGNFDFPTVQLPIGQFGSATQPAAPTPPGSSGPGSTGYPPGDADADADDMPENRQRKSSQERMRSPNARKQQGRRVGGREFPGQEEESGDRMMYADIPPSQPQYASQPEQMNYGIPAPPPMPLMEESRLPVKLIFFLLVLLIGGGSLYFYLSNRSEEDEAVESINAPATTPEAASPSSTAPAPTVTTPITKPAPSPTVPSEPAASAPQTPPSQAPAEVKPAVPPTAPVAQTPPTPAPTPPTPPTPPPAPTPPAAKVPIREKPVRDSRVAKNVPAPAPKKPPVSKPQAVEKPAPSAKNDDEPGASQPATPGGKTLHVTSSPPGAEVLVNFSKKGTTPVDVNLQNNSNKIIVRMSGYKRFETTIPKNSPEKELLVELEREDGDVELQPQAKEPSPSKPDPEPIAKTPDRERERPEPQTAPAVTKPKPQDSQPATGGGPIGVIFLSSSPARADIIIDGKNTGKKTPAKVELPSGSHRIEMVKSGQKATMDQQVNEGKNKALHMILQ